MTAPKRRVPPIYRKPALVPATPEIIKELAQQFAEQDPLGKLLNEWSDALRKFLTDEGLIFKPQGTAQEEINSLLGSRPSSQSVDGGSIWYRRNEISAGAEEAMDALTAIWNVRRETGDRRVLAAISLGEAITRLEATQAFARALDSYQRSRSRPTVPDAAIRHAVANHATYKDAAVSVGLSERQLRNRLRKMGEKRKSVGRPVKK